MSIVLRYFDEGDPAAAPVVLLHGGGSSAATWDRFAAALVAAGRRTIAVDLRGHGGSSRAASYPLAGFADDITGLLDGLGLDRVALVGHSLGAHAASLVAQRQPDRVTHLVLEEPPVPSRGPAGRPPRPQSPSRPVSGRGRAVPDLKEKHRADRHPVVRPVHRARRGRALRRAQPPARRRGRV
ncbi:MAG TPA: alpha/beta fold hydrolase, partial [Asanoa sp.]|nr:alpha/beta fold hydrolase [Asanoa sp.]